MNLPDESLLSAYLDGELDTPWRLVVEEALLSSPLLAERLQELASVRTTIHGMARPTAPADVSSAVVSQIDLLPRQRIRRALRSRPRLALAAGSALAVAAGTLIALGLTLGPWLSQSDDSVPPLAKQPVPTQPRAMPDRAVEPPALEAVPGSPTPAPIEALASADTTENPDSTLTSEDIRRNDDQERARELLNRPDVRRLTITVDRLAPYELEKVESTIRNLAPRSSSQGLLRIALDVVADPSRPGKAVVYAVVLSDREATHLRKDLEASSSDPIRDDTPDSSTLNQLAGIGRIEFTPGLAHPPASDLQPPPADAAVSLADRGELDPHPSRETVTSLDPVLRSMIRTPMPPSALAKDTPPSLDEATAGERASNRTNDVLAGPPAPDHARDASRERKSGTVYLVWVMTRETARDERH